MKTNHLVALFVALWAWDRFNSSQAGSPVDVAMRAETSNLAALQGTNFTRSLWDPLSGQPSYQFGAIYAPGGDPVMGTPSFSGSFGHL